MQVRGRAVLVMGSWLFLWVVVCLILWVTVTAVVFGWKPVVLTADTMAPVARRGDVLMVGKATAGDVDSDAIIVYRSAAGDVAVRRVIEVSEDGVRARGDAERLSPPVNVAHRSIIGTGRLVVPSVARPLVWLRSGAYLELVAAGLASGLALAVVAGWMPRLPSRRRRRGPS